MKRNVLTSENSQIYNLYQQDYPWLITLAKGCRDVSHFKEQLHNNLSQEIAQGKINPTAGKRILQLIENDSKDIDELSMGEKFQIQTMLFLWNFLCDQKNGIASPDFYIDLYYLFALLHHSESPEPDRTTVKKQMNRWPSGLEKDVVAIRAINKRRIINCLIQKIDRKKSPSSKYLFPESMNQEEKYNQVSEWWNSSRFNLAMAIKSPTELNFFLGDTLSSDTMELLAQAKKKGMPFFITPYYLSLLNTGSGYDDSAIRSYILYSEQLISTYGNINAWEKEDVVVADHPNAAGWLLPEGHNIHRRYPEVAILIPDSMGRACGGLCASCQRMYDFQSKRLNFDFEALKPKETWPQKLRHLMRYFEEDPQLRDILITGGDAFMSQNATLRNILEAVYRMALRKHKANLSRAEGEKYAEIQRVRLGSRLLAYLPSRINDELFSILKEFKEKASAIGICQFIVQTHFQSPLEVTPEAKQAVEAILNAGWTITNQLVYTVAASRRGHTAKLRQTLNSIGVVCYYTFSVKGFMENYAVFAPNSRSLQEQNEEKVFGRVPTQKQAELHRIIRTQRPLGKSLIEFLKENNLLFTATDRNVLNLPGIGKSMTFTTVGLTPEGKRILEFDHDASRRHSPIIHQMKKVYIVENKSIAAYLRQLKDMGEEIKEYTTIWGYTEGTTEPRFSIYEYPEFPFSTTTRMANLKINDPE